jgi:peptidylprolyl isomerase
MVKAKNGDKVIINYIGTLADGRIFDTTNGKAPFGFTIGGDQVFSSFNDALIDMEVGEIKTVTILAEDAYGPYYDDLTRGMPRNFFPEGATIKAGKRYPMIHKDGSPVMVAIKEVTDETVTIDANHPMAGKDLTFQIELMHIYSDETGDGSDSEGN